MKRTFFQRVQIWAIVLLSKIHWKQNQNDLLKPSDISELKQLLEDHYFIIATRKKHHLSTFLIAIGNFFLTRHWGFFSHVLMNLEDEVKNDDDFRFIEATGEGVHYSTFGDVFGEVDAVALIAPKNMELAEWTAALDRAKTYLGRPYDNLLDLKTDLEINCVELIRLALSNVPGYSEKFAEFENMVNKKKKLTPDMFVDCPDFEVKLRIKR